VAIFKRGRVYWYHFIFNGQHIQSSTKQGNPRVARQIEAAHRTALAKGEVGIREKKPAPTLADFCHRVETYARTHYEKTSTKTWHWYAFTLKTIRAAEMASRRLGEITPEHIAGFVASLQSREWEVASINSVLRTLRRTFRLARKWGVVTSIPEVSLLRGENHREHVVSPQEEAKYLAVATEPLASIATVLVDTGLRPDECFRLRWEHVGFSGERYGTLRVTHGKTGAARRTIPLTSRVRRVLETRWENAGRPEDGWV
jgi:integrase